MAARIHIATVPTPLVSPFPWHSARTFLAPVSSNVLDMVTFMEVSDVCPRFVRTAAIEVDFR